MGRLTLFDIALEKEVYYAGETIIGNVIVQLSEPMEMRGIFLKLTGEADVYWTETSTSGTGSNQTTTTDTYRAHETYIDIKMPLFAKIPGESGNPTHPEGHRVYPFQFQLPINLPSSFERHEGKVRYLISSKIDRPWRFDHKCRKAFTVLSVFDLNSFPHCAEPWQGQNQKQLCCLCCATGPVSALMSLDHTGYVPGQVIIINGQVENHTNRAMARVTVSLYMLIEFKATTKTKSSTEKLVELTKGQIEPGDSQVWYQERLQVPPVPPSQLNYCNIIDIYYFLQMKVHPIGPSFSLDVPKSSRHPSSYINIYIGTIPLHTDRTTFSVSGDHEAVNYSILPAINPQLQPSAPMPDSQRTAPPPTYAECMFGKQEMRIDGDDEHTHGHKQFAPAYPYYSWPQK